MDNLFIIPGWFLTYGIAFELAFAIITLIIGLVAFRVYKLSEQRSVKLFGISFIFISLHYFVQSFLNYSIISTLNQTICDAMKLESISVLNAFGAYSHMFFFIIGLATLAYMSFKIKNEKTYLMMILLPLVTIFFSQNKLLLFYAIASTFLVFISYYYLTVYLKKKEPRTLTSLIAFVFLLFGNLHFLVSVNHSLYFVIGHLLELIAYIFLLLNLRSSLKK